MKSDSVAIPLGKLEVTNATIDGMYGANPGMRPDGTMDGMSVLEIATLYNDLLPLTSSLSYVDAQAINDDAKALVQANLKGVQ